MQLRADYWMFQVLHDLHAVLTQLENPAFDHVVEAETQDKETMIQWLSNQKKAFDLAYASFFDPRPALQKLTQDPHSDQDGFTLAVILLLADSLNANIGFGVFNQSWEKLADKIRSLPTHRRSAIMNGFRLLFERSNHFGNNPVSEVDRTSTPAKDILPPLLRIAQRASQQELDQIALANYGLDAKAHREAITKVIWDQAGIMNEDQSWEPSEVIELTGHTASNCGFVTCTALLLMNEINRLTGDFGTDFRWAANATNYIRLPIDARRPILAGFRLIYETDLNWDPYMEISESKLETDGIAIPYFDN